MPQTKRTYHQETGSIGRPVPLTASARLKEAALEAAWPTRCAVCDAPGVLLCDSCRRALRFYDPWLACATCGAPFGRLQCCTCNTYTRERLKQHGSPLLCKSSVLFDETSGAIIRCYKDAGERRLADLIATMMVRALSLQEWSKIDAITYIPNSERALLRRGFDHMEEIARAISRITHLPLMSAFLPPKTFDQRDLTQVQRQENMSQAFALRPVTAALRLPSHLLIVDDVMTTGATMEAAAQILKDAGCSHIRGLTFARVV